MIMRSLTTADDTDESRLHTYRVSKVIIVSLCNSEQLNYIYSTSQKKHPVDMNLIIRRHKDKLLIALLCYAV